MEPQTHIEGTHFGIHPEFHAARALRFERRIPREQPREAGGEQLIEVRGAEAFAGAQIHPPATEVIAEGRLAGGVGAIAVAVLMAQRKLIAPRRDGTGQRERAAQALAAAGEDCAAIAAKLPAPFAQPMQAEAKLRAFAELDLMEPIESGAPGLEAGA